ncbi:MAG: DUF3077 domain-containing protein [Pseudomonas sp.]|uniref:DUF3077 domain-containing protein n=1 Tax=Pseudomonas sp. TaxID=306 RepID=UPI002FC86B26
MKKVVPDPPEFHLLETTETPFGLCDVGHPPLFSVCSGVNVEDALVHAALYLKCASMTAPLAVEYTREPGRGFVQSSLHSMEMAKGLIDSLLDGLERRAMR